MGLDSLMAVEIRNQLQAAVCQEHTLSNTLLFEQNTLNTLSTHLETQVLHQVFEREQAVKTLAIASGIRKEEPIAIVGMSCRFPGGANSVELFWQKLQDWA